jgi:23S rRNA pseudouridine955/2504/2580 synthase
MPVNQFDGCVLVTVDLGTGRTHQIRVHAAHIGHPVAGDSRYGGKTDLISDRYGLKRLFLHAAELTFDSPRQERLIRVESPLDDDLQSVLGRLPPRRKTVKKK